VGAATLAAVNNLAPPTILAQASRLNFSTRLFNLLVTNIPGPQRPLYVLGRRLEDLFPVAFLPKNHALAIAIMSYDRGIDYGLLGDYDALPDIGTIGEGIDLALQELLDAARGGPARAAPSARPAQSTNGGPVPITPSALGRPRRGPAADMRAKRAQQTRHPRKQHRA
jgi:diacylglycerol O-acyltransferase / wax synthase